VHLVALAYDLGAQFVSPGVALARAQRLSRTQHHDDVFRQRLRPRRLAAEVEAEQPVEVEQQLTLDGAGHT
jgi:predicted glycosyltransferase